jgi:hypothetical protein
VNRVVGVGPERACSPGLVNLEVRERRDGDGMVSVREEKQDTMLRSWMMMMTWPADGCRTTAGEGAS